jgi:MFS transporter, DHA2 family, multidrug resistance protein
MEQVQQYSASQTGEAMVLIGLPQLAIFPFVPRLMKVIDLRVMVFVGAAIFGASCFFNTHMATQYGGPQFQLANLVRAIGQPFTIVPLSAIATAGLATRDQTDGSALFNILRNLGGSVGTALLSTMITQREQFHDERLGEHITPYSVYVQGFLRAQTSQNLQHGGDPHLAMMQAYKTLQAAVQGPSFVMAFSECFLMIGSLLVAGSILIWFCRKPNPEASPGG